MSTANVTCKKCSNAPPSVSCIRCRLNLCLGCWATIGPTCATPHSGSVEETIKFSEYHAFRLDTSLPTTKSHLDGASTVTLSVAEIHPPLRHASRLSLTGRFLVKLNKAGKIDWWPVLKDKSYQAEAITEFVRQLADATPLGDCPEPLRFLRSTHGIYRRYVALAPKALNVSRIKIESQPSEIDGSEGSEDGESDYDGSLKLPRLPVEAYTGLDISQIMVFRLPFHIPLSGYLHGNPGLMRHPMSPQSLISEVSYQIFERVATTAQGLYQGKTNAAFVPWNAIVAAGHEQLVSPKPASGSKKKGSSGRSSSILSTPTCTEPRYDVVSWKHRRALESLKSLVIIGNNGKGKSTLAKLMHDRVTELRRVAIETLETHSKSQRLNQYPNSIWIPSRHSLRQKPLVGSGSSSILPGFPPYTYNHWPPYDASDSSSDESTSEFDHALKAYLESKNTAKPNANSRLTQFDRIWTNLFPHLHFMVYTGGQGTKHTLSTVKQEASWPSAEMSDGEREVFLLIWRVLNAGPRDFIFIDEPEAHLHRDALDILWNDLEAALPEALFVYVTHDLDFALHRVDSEIICIRDFYRRDRDYVWTWDCVSQFSSPVVSPSFALQMLGTRATSILLVEGRYDFMLYSTLYGSHFRVIDCGGSNAVDDARQFLTHTADASRNLLSHGFAGRTVSLKDRDRDVDKALVLNQQKVPYQFHLENVAEIENLFCSWPVFKMVVTHGMGQSVANAEDLYRVSIRELVKKCYDRKKCIDFHCKELWETQEKIRRRVDSVRSEKKEEESDKLKAASDAYNEKSEPLTRKLEEMEHALADATGDFNAFAQASFILLRYLNMTKEEKQVVLRDVVANVLNIADGEVYLSLYLRILQGGRGERAKKEAVIALTTPNQMGSNSIQCLPTMQELQSGVKDRGVDLADVRKVITDWPTVSLSCLSVKRGEIVLVVQSHLKSFLVCSTTGCGFVPTHILDIPDDLPDPQVLNALRQSPLDISSPVPLTPASSSPTPSTSPTTAVSMAAATHTSNATIVSYDAPSLNTNMNAALNAPPMSRMDSGDENHTSR